MSSNTFLVLEHAEMQSIELSKTKQNSITFKIALLSGFQAVRNKPAHSNLFNLFDSFSAGHLHATIVISCDSGSKDVPATSE